MRKSFLLILVAIFSVGGWQFFDRFQVEGLDQIRLVPRGAKGRPEGHPARGVSSVLPVARSGQKIRIATFNIQVFGTSKSGKMHVMEYLARITRQFDLLAIQEIRSRSDDILPRFVDLVNSTGRQYDYVIGPRLGRTNGKEQYAFVFDRESIEVDRQQIYTVYDPDDMLHREPLVANFRVRGPPPKEAFTFTLVNIHTDPDETDQELDALGDVYYAVRDDGRGEDDVIVLGNLNVDHRHMRALGQVADINWVVFGEPTNTRRTQSYDNILFQSRVTSEFTGLYGVLDYMREFNLTMQEALEISDHLPVWAEFSVYEGGKTGRVATRPERQ